MRMLHYSAMIVVAAIVAPFLARIPGTITHGSEWFWSYASGPVLVAFIAAFSLIPAGVLIGLLARFGAARIRVGLGLTGMTVVSLILHAPLDLAFDAQAAIALVIFPILAAIGAVVGYLAGWVIAALGGR